MATEAFKLGMFARASTGADRAPFAGLVLDDSIVDIDRAYRAYVDSLRGRAAAVLATRSIDAMLEDWARNFGALQELAAFVREQGQGSDRLNGAVSAIAQLQVLPPIRRPSKILNAAANYSGHVAEMRQYTLSGGNVDKDKIFKGDKAKAYPYLFLKAPSARLHTLPDT